MDGRKEEAIGKFIDELLSSVFPLPRDEPGVDFSSRRQVGERARLHEAG